MERGVLLQYLTSVRFNRGYLIDEVLVTEKILFTYNPIGVVFISGLVISPYGK